MGNRMVLCKREANKMITIDFTTKPKPTIPEYIRSYGYKFLIGENGELHSYNDMPAMINPGGAKFWYKHGTIHRDNDLPAVIYPSGTKEYWINGKRIK